MYAPIDSCVEWLDSIPREVLWSHFVRGVATAYMWVTFILARQTKAIPESEGIMPLKARFDRYRTDFPAPQRYFYFPSYLHLYHEDWFLPFFLRASCLIGGLLVWTGLHSRFGIFLMWSTYLSYANVSNFMYPWDCLILETGFLTMFLPCLEYGWMGSLVSQPNPILLFSIRYLIWRLMFGFGKMKFLGMKWHDLSYLKGFLINQPLPTVLGWFLHKAPLPIHVASYFFLFFVEIPGPFLYFICGWPRLLGFVLIQMLQVGIQLTGTFGYFNLLTSIISIGLLDLRSSLFDDLVLSEVFTFSGQGLINVGLIFLLLVHCVFIPFNNWCGMAFLYWPGLSVPASWIGHLLRFILPWHVSHAYGVFFPHSSPPLKWIPLIEGTDEEVIDTQAPLKEQEEARLAGGVEEKDAKWEIYTYKFLISDPYLTPRFVAPYHPRMEHAILYEALGLGPQTLLAPLTTGDPYENQPKHMLETVCHGLMREKSAVEDLFRKVPFGRKSLSGKKVRALRVSMYLFQPTSISTLFQTGRWYDRWYSHVHIPLMTQRGFHSGRQGSLKLREPECFHPEMILWQDRTPVVQQLWKKLKHAEQQQQSTMAAVGPSTSDHDATKVFDSLTLASHTPQEIESYHQHASLRPIDTPSYTFAHQLVQEGDVSEFWRLVTSLSNYRTQILRPKDLPISPLQNGSHRHGLSNTTLEESSNRPFLVDRPWNTEDPSHWSRIIVEMQTKVSEWSKLDQSTKDLRLKTCSRLTLLLLKRLTPYYHGPDPSEPTRTAWSDMNGETPISQRMKCSNVSHLHLPSFFHLYLFCHHIIGFGCETYETILRTPSKGVEYLSTYCIESCLFFFGLFHSDILAFQSRKRRLISVFSHPDAMVGGGVTPGALPIYYNFLGTQFLPRTGYPESYPTLYEPKSICSGWRVEIGNMPTYSPGRQDQTTKEEETKKMN